MLPLRDVNRRYTTPVLNLVLIGVTVLVFFYQASLGPRAERALVFTFGMIPARIPMLFGGGADVTLAQAFLPLLTSMFLHGGLLHLLGNMWFLWVFGDNVEDALGHFNFLMFYVVCGVGASVVHTVANLGSTVPAVGASGAISGVMGAYLVRFPGARIVTWIPPIFIFPLPAVILLGYWFLIQFLSGVGSVGGADTGGTAWWAHVGGFLLGALIAGVSRPR